MQWGKQMTAGNHMSCWGASRPSTPLAVTAIDGQATAGVDAKQARFPTRGVAVRAPEPAGMKMLLQPGNTLVVVEEVNDRKIHTRDCTYFALLV